MTDLSRDTVDWVPGNNFSKWCQSQPGEGPGLACINSFPFLPLRYGSYLPTFIQSTVSGYISSSFTDEGGNKTSSKPRNIQEINLA